jgi:hypothetical protein
MILQFRIIIRVSFKHFQSQKCLIFFCIEHIFFLKQTFARFYFLVHFSSFFLKYSVMENLVEIYKKFEKLVTFLP